MAARSFAVALLLALRIDAFVGHTRSRAATTTTALSMTTSPEGRGNDRRTFLSLASSLLIPTSAGTALSAVIGGLPQPASAKVFFDPAMYGDQELRGSAVNSLKESVRRSVLQDPQLAPAFYQLAILDGLSYDASTNEFGPDGRVVTAVLSSKDDSQYMRNLKKACEVLVQSCVTLRRLTSITIGDAVALGGTAAIESVGGPFLSVQLGRIETPRGSPISPLDLNVLSGSASYTEVDAAFARAGLTAREMTALLGTLLTLDTVQKTRSTADWKASAKPKFREPGKIGRVSDFKPLTEQDIADLTEVEDEDDEGEGEGWYIAETFGTRDEQFGSKVGGGDISEKTFNKYLKELNDGTSKRGGADVSRFGWIAAVLLDKDNPTAQQWVGKYAGSYLNYNKDLGVAYNAITRLGEEYTGGKYESLLKNRKRKTLNDDD